MSSPELKKIAAEITTELAKLGGDAGREDLVRQHGQLLVINKRRFNNILRSIFPKLIGSNANAKKALKEIWKNWDIHLKSYKAKITDVKDGSDILYTAAERIKQLEDAIKNLRLSKLDHAYIITSYRTIKAEKNSTGELGSIIRNAFTNNKINKRGMEAGLKKIGGKDGFFGAQLGHEEEGRGVASAGMKALKAESMASGITDQKDRDILNNIVDEIRNEITFSIDHDQAFDENGKFKKDYVPILTWQKAVSNQEQKNAESRAAQILTDSFKDIANMKGSITMKDALGEVLFSAASPKRKKNVRIVGRARSTIQNRSKGMSKKGYKRPIPITMIKSAGIDAKSVKNIKARESRQFSPFSLMAMIQEKLPQTVQKNMRSPRLENRTGRLARSVKLTDITQTRQGFLSMGYTYEHNPYKVFEVGQGDAPWATPDRDPRKLIDASIREVASKMALGRFYTRRI